MANKTTPGIQNLRGKIGIGTVDPFRKLHVVAEDGQTEALVVEGNDLLGKQLILGYNATGNGYGTIQTVYQGTAFTNLAINSSGGNVGIGTTNPTAKLYVKGDAVDNVGLTLLENDYASGGIYFPALSVINTRGNHSYGIVSEFRTNTSGDSDRPSILFYGAQASHSWQIGQVTSGWGTNDNFGIGYRASNDPTTFDSWPTNYFTITTGGNVGIGTTSPVSKLHTTGPITISDVGSSDNTTLIQFSESNNYDEFAIKADFSGAGGENVLKFTTDLGGGDILAMKGDGNVGIGTTDPSHTLTVAGDGLRSYGTISSISNGALLGRYSGGTGIDSGELILATDAKTGWDEDVDEFGRIRFYSTDSSGIGARDAAVIKAVNGFGDGSTTTTFSGELAFFTSAYNANVAEAVRIDGDGNVGISTSSPSSILHIGGGTVPTTVLDGVLLTLGGGQYYQASDGTKTIFMGVDASDYGILGTFTNHPLGFRTNNSEKMRIKSDGTIQFNSYGAGFLQTDANGNITAGAVTTSDTLDDVTDNGNSTTNTITVGGVTSTGGGEMQGGDLYYANGGDDGAGTHIGNVWYSVSTSGSPAPVGVYESAVIATVNSGTHGRSDIVFKTKNNDTANFGTTSERMRILKDGRVGINETNPLFGRFQVTQSANNDEAGIGVLSASAGRSMRLWVDETVSYISSGDNGAGILSLNPGGGNVGIGENNPVSLLHLGKNAGGVNIISFGDAGINGPHGLDFYGDDATRTLKYSIYYRTSPESISMETNDGTKRFEIDQSGAVTFNEAFTFPTADGSAGAALITNGSGALSWNTGYKQYSPVGWNILNGITYTANGQNIQSASTQILNGTTPVRRNSATEFEATQQGWYEIKYSFLIKNNYADRANVGAYMGFAFTSGGGIINGSHSTEYVRYSTYGQYAQVQNSYFFYAPDNATRFYLFTSLLSGSMNMTTQSAVSSMISFRYINNDIT